MSSTTDSDIRKGDIVRYTPTERTLGWEPHPKEYGYQIDALYRVLAVDEEGYLTIHPKLTPSHRTNFKKVGDFGGPISTPEPWPDPAEK